VSAFIDEQKGDFGLELTCQTIRVSASAYYQRATGQRSSRAVADERRARSSANRTARYVSRRCPGARSRCVEVRSLGAPRVELTSEPSGVGGGM